MKPAGWGFGTKFAAADANGLDLNGTYALDKRASQTDDLGSVVSCTGTGRIVETYAAGANANTTYTAGTARNVVIGSGITANRVYTLSTAGAVTGDRIFFQRTGGGTFTITIQDAGSNVLATLYPRAGINIWGLPTCAEFLFDGTNWALLRTDGMYAGTAVTYLTSSSWDCPANVKEILVIGWGGGGGGAGGGYGSNTANATSSGGGGGGGAMKVVQRVSVVPGRSYNVNIGAGGPGFGVNTMGGNGGDTTIVDTTTSLAVFSALGAQGGSPGFSPAPTPNLSINGGGAPSRLVTDPLNGSAPDQFVFPLFIRPQTQCGGPGGGFGTYSGKLAGPSPEGIAGGSGGSMGAIAGSYPGGGYGGGGGAGPAGTAGLGGSGGAGNNVGGGSGSVGNNGTNASANSGAGGGGGGGGGQGIVGNAACGNGGSGGSGFLCILPIH